MTATWTGLGGNGVVLDAGRSDFFGAGLSALLPLAGLAVVAGGAEAAGLAPLGGAVFGLPAWVNEAAMIVMLPMWGLARWLVARRGSQGRVAGWWIVALIVVVTVVPLAGEAMDVLLASVVSMLVLLIGIAAASRAAAVSGLAAILLMPGLAWTGAGALVGFSGVAGGWSPPFALTDTSGH